MIDGENLRHYVENVIKENEKKKELTIIDVNFEKMFDQALKDFKISKKIYYSAKLQICPETEKKSKIVIEKQRILKSRLEKEGYEFLIAGNVRPQIIKEKNNNKIVFREKGVDVRIAVDLIKFAVDKTYETIVLCSSDSDLQPAIREAKSRGLKIIYLGFEIMPNKGLTFTTNRTILLRNSEVISSLEK